MTTLTWPADSPLLPLTIYLEGTVASSTPRDVVLTLTYNGDACDPPACECSDTVLVTVMHAAIIIDGPTIPGGGTLLGVGQLAAMTFTQTPAPFDCGDLSLAWNDDPQTRKVRLYDSLEKTTEYTSALVWNAGSTPPPVYVEAVAPSETLGDVEFTLTWTCADTNPTTSSQAANATVYAVDLDAEGVEEVDQLDPGLILPRNGDYDEGNKDGSTPPLDRPDYLPHWNGSAWVDRIVEGDNELVTLTLRAEGPTTHGYWSVAVRISDNAEVKLWHQPGPGMNYEDVTYTGFQGEPTESLEVEGIRGSTDLRSVELQAYYQPTENPSVTWPSDLLKVTVFAADLELAGMGTDGKVIVKNDDDDNYDGQSDLTQTNVQNETNLCPLTITWTPAILPMYLKKGSGSDKIKVWRGAEKTDEVTFNGTDNRFTEPPKVVYVEGCDHSYHLKDIEPFGNHDNSDRAAGIEKLTVLWITSWLSKTDTNRLFADDNDPLVFAGSFRDPDYAKPVDLKCGIHMYADRAGLGIEVKGYVNPSEFSDDIVVEREVQAAYYVDENGGSTYSFGRSFCNPNFKNRTVALEPGHDSNYGANDPDPQSEGSIAIYDWDPPGIYNIHPKWWTIRNRANFVYWPAFESERCGALGYYSMALSIRPNAPPNQTDLGQMPFESTYSGRGDNLDVYAGESMTTIFRKCLAYDLASQQEDVWCPLTVQSGALQDATVGVRYEELTGEVVVVPTVGGIPPLVYSVPYGGMPPGLMLNANTGAITGIPNNEGSYQFTIRVTDPYRVPTPMTVEGGFSIEVLP